MSWVRDGLKRHKYRKVRVVVDQEAVMPAARLFAAGIISRVEMMARISPKPIRGVT